jgi:hypothetical protein
MKMLKLVMLVAVAGLVAAGSGKAWCRPLAGTAPRGGVVMEPEDLARAEEKYFEFLEENMPSEAEEIEAHLGKLRERNPELYRRRIGRVSHSTRRMQLMKEKNPERFEDHIQMMRQEMKCRELTKAYRQAETDREKEKIEAQLKKSLEALFDKKLAENEVRVKELEKKIIELKERAVERKKDKDEIVRRRLDNLIAREKGLEW